MNIRMLLLMILLLPLLSCAQAPVFRNYTSQNGLPSSETYCSLLDSRGYMWFGSDRGIVRFDGYSFRVFTSADGLPDNTIFRLTEDGRHRIWFTSYSSQTGYIYQDSIYNYYNKAQAHFSPSFPLYSFMTVDQRNKIWMNSSDSLRFRVMRINEDGSHDTLLAQPPPGIRRIYTTHETECINSGSRSAETIELYSLYPYKKLLTFRTASGIPSHMAWQTQRNGKRWIFINNEVILFEHGQWRRIISCEGKVLSFQVDSAENIWIGFLYKGLALYRAADAYRSPKLLLNNQSISSICRDRENGLWMTSLENGIYYLPSLQVWSYTHDNGLPVAKVMRVEAVDSDLVMILSNRDFVFKPYGKPIEVVRNREKVLFADIRYNGEGRVYYTKGATAMKKLRKQLVGMPNSRRVFISKNRVLTIERWSVISFDKNGIEQETIFFDSISSLQSVFETDDGTLLLGALDGLYRYRHGQLERLANRHPLWGSRISEIRRIDGRHLAIGTIGNGLLIVKDDNFAAPLHYSEKNGMPSDMCQALLVESDTVLDVGTNKGLCRILYPLDPARARSYITNVNDGLPSNEIYDLCRVKQELWIATRKGISEMPVAITRKSNYQVPFYIESVTNNEVRSTDLSPVSLPYDKRSVGIFFTALDYRYNAGLHYKYRLRNTETNWTYTYNRSVIFSSLSPGTYTFELAIVNPYRAYDPRIITYTFTILPPFWLTWWFSLLAVLVMIGSAFLYIHLRIRSVKYTAWLRSEAGRAREQALRSQMNPHFIYNALISVQQYILKNEPMPSVTYLSKFSRLMRLTFNNTSRELVPLQSDLDALMLYTDLENLRFQQHFTLDILIDPELNADTVQVPPLMMQPFVENAVLHGLRNKQGPGSIRIEIVREEKSLLFRISDNGIGREKAAAIGINKQRYLAGQERGKSSGTLSTIARIGHFWGIPADEYLFSITDLYDAGGAPAGTIVQFRLPHTYENNHH